MALQSGASFAKNYSRSHLFTLKAKRQQGYKLLVIPKDLRLGPTVYKENWLLHEREASPYPGRCYFQKYVDKSAKKEVKDIFRGGRGYGDVPEPSGKRAPLGLDAHGVLFIFIVVLLVVAAAVTAAVTLRAAVFAPSVGAASSPQLRLPPSAADDR